MFKSERPRISKPQCNCQVDVNYNLSKPVTTHYLLEEREAASAKPHHMIVSSNSRISSKNMTRFSSNDMVHNHYLEEAKKRTQECSRNSEPNLVWKPTSKIFKTVDLRWVPTRKIFASSTTKVDIEPPNGSNADITNQNKCEQTLDVSAITLDLSASTSFNPKKEGIRVWLLKRQISHKPGLLGIFITVQSSNFNTIDVQAMTSNHNSSELELHDHNNEQSSSKLVPKVVPPVDKTATSR
nr:hypothetical protein [Tanacetum cinerariifolium]